MRHVECHIVPHIGTAKLQNGWIAQW